ncbi:DUF6119 family protein [Ensifer sp. ENS12]|uniref:DUF6119 family protein n=1 Tax=Ensifer sp. ENS12 TaxID=2854774 RepID=UPI001C46B7A3|nr:DUF6119 family protein [Ensifer sp. ENS12]MBV7519025.1 TIGR04141 family sporadically distributed protein [Ensifer sp. ENS12]
MIKKIDDKKAMSLSLRLLRSGKTIEDSLRAGHGLTEVPAEGGRLWVEQTNATPPAWFPFVGSFAAQPLAQLENKSCGAVLFLEIVADTKPPVTRTMALAFGGAWHALDPNAFERNFGLRVALNSMPRANLKNLDVATLDATTFQKRIQASRRADLGNFGIDVQRDLLRLAGGVPTDTAFATALSGKDALTLHTHTSRTDVVAKCRTALKLFGDTSYKKDYAWIDYITLVQEQDRITALDATVFAEITALVGGGASDLHLTFPDIISPEEGREIGYFGTGMKPGAKETFLDLAIEDYIEQLRAGRFADIADMNELKVSHEIAIVADGKKDKRHRRRVYECFVYEVTDSGKTFVLFAGDWYMVDAQFHADVERDFQAVLSKKPFLPSTKCETEQELIAELNKDADLLMLDQVKASPAGASGSNLEPCDFLSRTKQFIHLKDGGSSAPISHLWNQGLVSADAFIRDQTFRDTLRKEAIKRQNKYKKAGFEGLLPDGRSKPVPTDYTVVFGIMRVPYKKSKKPGLPFFSKVSLRPIVNRIQAMSFGVEVHLIAKKPKAKAPKSSPTP